MALEVSKLRGSDRSARVLVYSFNDSYYLIEANDFVYQVKNLDLAAQDIYRLKKIILEAHVSTVNSSVKKDSIIDRRFLASEDFEEAIRISDEGLAIFGTLLNNGSYNDSYHDLNNPFLILKSNDYIYQIKRQHIFTLTPELLNSDQSKIEVSVPIEDVQYIWTTKLIKTIKLNH